MSDISRWLNSAAALDRLGLALLHFVWEGLLVALLVAAVVHGLRVARGRGRYAVYLVGMLVMATAPVVNLALVTPPARSRGLERASLEHRRIERLKGEVDLTRDAPPPLEIGLADQARARVMRALPWVSAAWFIGVVALSARLVGAFGLTLWLRRSARMLPDDLRQRVAAVARRVGMDGFTRVFQSSRVRGPMALGLIKPMVLLPAAMVSGVPVAMLEAIIAHELAHVRRLDLWVNLLQRVVETLLFYHPAVWWISRRIREEREICCDEAAVLATGSPVEYATMLSEMAQAVSRDSASTDAVSSGAALMTAMATRHTLLARVRHLLNLSADHRPIGRGLAAGIVLLAVAAFVMIGSGWQRRANAATTRPASAATQPTPPLTEREKARVALQDRLLERSVLLNNLKQRYTFRLQELQRDLREKAVRLSIDGMGTPGRLSAKEVELGDRLKASFEQERTISDTKSRLEQVKRQMQKGERDPAMLREVEKDPRLAGYLGQVDEIDLKLAELGDVGKQSPDVLKLERRKEVLAKKAEDRKAQLLAAMLRERVDGLQNALETAQEYSKTLRESIDAIKQDLGDLTTAMSQYLTLKDEEQATRELLRQVQQQLDRLSNIESSRILDEADVLKEFDRFLLSGSEEAPKAKR